MTSARQLALDALARIEDEGAYANLVLGPMLSASSLTPEDRRFATDLVYGTTRMRRACDALVDRFVSSEPDSATRRILRLGSYQLGFGGVPAHAAVSATVDLAPKNKRGFVNAVLRRVSTTPMIWPNDATRLSYPDWIVERLRRELGSDAEAMLECMNTPPPVTRRADGYTQDQASQWVVEAVGARPGEIVADVCAGPGGKSTGLSASGAKVVAADRNFVRARLVRDNSIELGQSIPVVVADGANPAFAAESFDRVLIDAPCSGLGALRRRADARWRIRESDVGDLVALQASIIAGAAPLVKSGGLLVYSVCTVLAAESIDHATPFGFEPVGRAADGIPELGPHWREFGHGYRVLPHEHDTDGMVVIRYRRRS
ncbi:MAG: hypothetical protein RL391_1557 [Actinomycetota bacterium]|jgi:16S rRNA (cytosine967-C5)-methyltransferase